jgi:hypothetical protein
MRPRKWRKSRPGPIRRRAATKRSQQWQESWAQVRSLASRQCATADNSRFGGHCGAHGLPPGRHHGEAIDEQHRKGTWHSSSLHGHALITYRSHQHHISTKSSSEMRPRPRCLLDSSRSFPASDTRRPTKYVRHGIAQDA